MSSAQELIERIASGEDRERAARDLADLGGAAVEPVLNAVRSMSAPPFVLSQVLFQIENRNAVEPLMKFVKDDNTMVQLFSIEALGYLCTGSVRSMLLQLVQDQELVPTAKRVAAYSIGVCGTREAVPILIEVQEQARSNEEWELAIACAVSRARLGDHGGLSDVLLLTQLKGDETIRASAVHALRYIAGPGVFAALKRAVKDRAAEVRRAAVEAIYCLGNHTTMDQLFVASSNRDEQTANNAQVYLRYLTGSEISDKAADRKKWWATHTSDFSEQTCYRDGVPVTLDQFASLLEDESTIGDIVRDFAIYTGRWIGSDHWILANPIEARTRVRSSIAQLRGQFQRGALYKSGEKIDLAALLDE